MGEDYKAKIEVTLGNDNMADMTLNGSINDLLNLMADVMAQTIVDFSDTKNKAEKAMEKVRYSMPNILEEFWNNKITNGKAAQSAAAGAAKNVMQEAQGGAAMDKKLLKEEYKRLLTKAIEGRPGGMALMIVLEETDFYNSPASAKHHLNVPGGLLLHSLNVARAALELCENMPQFARCDKNAVLTAALLHDACKAGNYIQKPDGSYQYRDTDLLGHGEASVINIQHWIHLTEKEVLAIRWHMGAYTGERDWDTLSKVYDRYPEVLCLHMADMIATHIMEAGE